MPRLTFSLLALVIVTLFSTSVFADAKADHAALAESATKVSANASTLSAAAKAADDRGARKKFAPAAQDLADDLAAFARRAAKDVPFKTLAADGIALVKDARGLVELVDEVEDKDERKTLRAQTVVVQQGVEALAKQLLAAATNEEKDGAKPAERFTGFLYNNSDACSWAENVYFIVSANGQQVWKSGLVFPGKNTSVVLYKASYLVQVVDTAGSKLLAKGTLEANKEGWTFKSGCVNQD